MIFMLFSRTIAYLQVFLSFVSIKQFHSRTNFEVVRDLDALDQHHNLVDTNTQVDPIMHAQRGVIDETVNNAEREAAVKSANFSVRQ